MTGNSAVITGNSAKTNGAGIYLESRSTLRLSGKPDFGGTGVKDDGSIDDTVGNFSAVTLAENAMNGGKDYTRSRQDIYLAGIGNPLASIVVTGAIDMEPGSVWVLCGMKQHYEMLKQFAVFESDAVKTAIQDAEKLESTMQVFRNAQTDLLSGCGAEYLTGKEGDDIGGRKCIYWNGGFDIAFQKINGNGEVLDGAQFKLYKTNEGGTKGDLAATATSGNVAKANAVTIRIKEAGTVVDREIYGDGLVVLEKVSPGTYILEESVVPTGWKALEASYKVVVNHKGNIAISANDTEAGKARFVKGDDDKYTAPVGAIADDAETTEVYTILNISDQVRKVLLKKVDSAYYTPLKDTKFTVCYADRQTVVKVDGVELKDLTSGAGGAFFIGKLPHGIYYMVETQTPTSPKTYVTPTHYFAFKVDANGVSAPVEAEGTTTWTPTKTVAESTREVDRLPGD